MDPKPSNDPILDTVVIMQEFLGNSGADTLISIFIVVGAFLFATAAFLISIKATRDFIEANPKAKIPSYSFSLLLSAAAVVTRGIIGRDFEEQVEKSQELEGELSKLSIEVQRLKKRNPVSMLPFGVDEVTVWQAPIVASRNRLLGEIERVRTRSTAYLTFGVVLSLAAVVLFFVIIFYLDDISPNANALAYVKDFLPKFTLAVMVQVIASFFLRMHVSSEAEIKWTSNELTNLEHRFTAMALSEAGMSEELVSDFSKTERNFILDKDQKALRSHEKVTVESMVDVLKEVVAKKSPSK